MTIPPGPFHVRFDNALNTPTPSRAELSPEGVFVLWVKRRKCSLYFVPVKRAAVIGGAAIGGGVLFHFLDGFYHVVHLLRSLSELFGNH
jgi:hypothetical protein